jgi:hypothetical protein
MPMRRDHEFDGSGSSAVAERALKSVSAFWTGLAAGQAPATFSKSGARKHAAGGDGRLERKGMER